MRFLRISAAVVALLAAPSLVFADGMPVNPGLWEFTSSMPGPLGSDSTKQVHRTCVRDKSITPERVMARLKECRIWNATFKDPFAKWKMSCQTPAGPMVGSGSLRSNGTVVAGSVEMTMTIGSLEVPMTGAFRGRRVGACR